MTEEELSEMERRFPPTELTFPEALDQIRAGRQVSRVDGVVHSAQPFIDMASPLTAIDMAANDWIIIG